MMTPAFSSTTHTALRLLVLLFLGSFGASAMLAQAPAQPRSIFENVSAADQAAYRGAVIPLWTGRAPEAKGEADGDIPRLYPVPTKRSGAPVGAVIVLPGGGYTYHAAHEAFPIAEHFRNAGLAAFVLQYRLRPYGTEVSLIDAQRAVRVLRSRASELGIDPTKIAVIGFSAGGHLAANLSTNADDGRANATDRVERESCRIQSAMLIYPWLVFDRIARRTAADRELAGVVKLKGLHRSVDEKTPPTFLLVGYDDNLTPYENCLAYTAKLHEAGVRFELHVIGTGRHGFGMRSPDPRLQTWPQLATNWMITSGFLPGPSTP